jgi:hypothetical protein
MPLGVAGTGSLLEAAGRHRLVGAVDSRPPAPAEPNTAQERSK